MSKIHLVDPQPFQIGPRRETARTWSPPVAINTRKETPTGQLDRMGAYVSAALGGTTSDLGQISAVRWFRLLTPYQIDLIYQRCPDVRSSIDQIVRQVATHAWDVAPTVELHDPKYDTALETCVDLKRWLKKPTTDGFTFQEVMTAFLTDLLKHDAAALERVRDRKGRLVEAVPLYGPNVHPIQDVRGRLDHYSQSPFSPTTSVLDSPATSTRLETDQVLYMMQFPNTISPEGWPLLESLVNEVISLMRAADFWSHSVDLDEVPPGLLVLVGVANDAAERMRAEYESKPAADWKIRILSSPVPGDVDARWVQFRKDPKDLMLVELCDEIRRTVWRVFGVKPVEQGATEGVNRATAQVQLDASASHLLQPILELVASKINMLLIADLVPPELLDLVEFRWVDHKELSPEERLAQAQELCAYVNAGILTRNEARARIGYDPFEELEKAEGGDVPTLVDGKSGVVPLTMVLGKPDAAEQAAELAAQIAAGGSSGDGSGGTSGDGSGDSGSSGSQGDGETEGGDAPGDQAGTDGGSDAASRPEPRLRGIRVASGHANIRAALGDGPPEGWLRPDVRSALTVDLDGLWEQMSGYMRDVDGLWDRAVEGTLEAVAAEQTLDASARARIQGALASEITKLATDWALATRPRYRAVAEASRRQVGNWAGTSGTADEIRAEADVYHLRAIGFLTAEDGLLTDVAREVLRVLVEDYDGATRAVPGGTSITGALTAVSRAWGALRHRVANWAAKLVALGHATLSTQAQQAASSFSPADPLWCEWADVGPPGECQSCLDLGSKGWVELASLNGQVPADGRTECRARCRCVLRIVRRSEIDEGTASLAGSGNQ